MNERAAQILAMRAEGKTLQEIATYLEISRSRVNQIYVKAKAQQQQAELPGYVMDNEPLLKLGLNVRTCNALNRSGIQTVGQLLDLLKNDLFLSVRNIGPLAHKELLEKLRAHGRLVE